ncbi:hypothetical protein CJP72_22185, partial [Citrobacter sp. NCU1]|uniref:hypothetical protein n=1 Tax=Citrobacter sp. NCU1 TaxID=2026683 RepID=UPI0021736E74|nr:hypothetical protein [Citrobacter sp. NCU1]
CGFRARFTGTLPRARPGSLEEKTEVHREAAIFLPGAGIVKGAAIAPLTRSRDMKCQRSEEHEVNGTVRKTSMLLLLDKYLRLLVCQSLTDWH